MNVTTDRVTGMAQRTWMGVCCSTNKSDKQKLYRDSGENVKIEDKAMLENKHLNKETGK